jgi:signal transduction histidine kinase
MNNPLAIISGRSQLLVQRLEDPDLKGMAGQIVERSHELSDMITALRSVSEPAIPSVRSIDPGDLLETAVKEICGKNKENHQLKLELEEDLPQVNVDPTQIARAVRELVHNA